MPVFHSTREYFEDTVGAELANRQRQMVREQILWARLKLCQAQKDEVYMEAEAWTGYLNALHWVEEVLLKRGDQAAEAGGQPADSQQPV